MKKIEIENDKVQKTGNPQKKSPNPAPPEKNDKK